MTARTPTRRSNTAETIFRNKIRRILINLADARLDFIRRKFRESRALVVVLTGPPVAGVDRWAIVQEMFGVKKDTINSMLNIATRFTEDEVMEILGRRDDRTQFTLTWTHAIVLGRIQDTAKVRELAAAAVAGCWSTKRLQAEIMVVIGRRSKGGRKPKTPDSFEGMLEHIRVMTQSLRNAANHVWLDPADGLDARAAVDFKGDRPPTGVIDSTTLRIEDLQAAEAAVRRVINRLQISLAAMNRGGQM